MDVLQPGSSCRNTGLTRCLQSQAYATYRRRKKVRSKQEKPLRRVQMKTMARKDVAPIDIPACLRYLTDEQRRIQLIERDRGFCCYIVCANKQNADQTTALEAYYVKPDSRWSNVSGLIEHCWEMGLHSMALQAY